MNKEEMRKKYKIIRKNIDDKNNKDKFIFLKVIKNNRINKCSTLLIYVSTQEEIDTKNIINYFINKKKVAVPKIINNQMDFYYIKNINELKEGYSSILEPTTNNKVTNYDNCICITPAICFDINNYRIGYGKGYYDDFLNKHNVYSIGLCYKECLVEKICISNNDIKVAEVIIS